MKYLILGLLSLNLFAVESLVGSFAVYNIDGPTFKGIKKVALKELNETENTYLQVTTMTKDNGDVDIVEEKVDVDDINTQQENLMILELCETDLSGRKSRETVKAGTFEACILKDDDSTFYFANVPFGYIKSLSDAQKVELTSYSF